MNRALVPALVLTSFCLAGCMPQGNGGPGLQLVTAAPVATAAPSSPAPQSSLVTAALSAPSSASAYSAVSEPAAAEAAPAADALKSMLANAPLPPARPVALGGKPAMLLASADEEAEVEEDEPVSAAVADVPEPAAQIADASRPVAEPAPDADGVKTADASKTKGPGYFAAYDTTVVSCFPEPLRAALNTIADHFNKPVEVTSGLRTHGRRGSMHRHCMAADIRIAGVAPSAIATYAKGVPGVNGIGSYRHTDLIHVDIRQEQMAWRY